MKRRSIRRRRSRRRKPLLNPVPVVLLSGHARAGKDTAADLLVKHAGFVKLSFAHSLKVASVALTKTILEFNDARLEWFTDQRFKERPLTLLQRNKDQINALLAREKATGGTSPYMMDVFGVSAETKRCFTPRQVLQAFGTNVVRDTMGADVWVNVVKDKIQRLLQQRDGPRPVGFVISDCRFPNEIESFRNQPDVFQCISVRLTDPSEVRRTSVSLHISETALDSHEFDVRIVNDKRFGEEALLNALDQKLQDFGITVLESSGGTTGSTRDHQD